MTRITPLVALLAAACVSARGEDDLGHVSFVASSAQSSPDYLPGSAGRGGGEPAAPASAGIGSPPPAAGVGATPPPMGGAAAPSPPIGGTPAAPSAGTPAAMGGRPGAPVGGMAVPVAGSGMPAAGAAAPAPSATGGMLTVEFTSVNQGGRYAPRNVGAVWIETATGTFVKTLERWAGIRANHLEHWASKSGGWGSRFGGGGNTADMMDAVSRATLRSHEKHTVSWDMQDASGKVVPDGKYTLVIEVTEDNRIPGAYAGVEFEKGPAPQMIMAPDKAPYSGLTLRYQP